MEEFNSVREDLLGTADWNYGDFCALTEIEVGGLLDERNAKYQQRGILRRLWKAGQAGSFFLKFPFHFHCSLTYPGQGVIPL